MVKGTVMAQQNWFQRLLQQINNEYERRVRAASLVQEYGDHHGHHDHDEDDGEVAEIVNIPRGTRLPPPPPQH